MKKLTTLMLCVFLAFSCVSAYAEENVFSLFQPYTSVDLSVFENAGYTTSYDEFNFTAELYPPYNTIGDATDYDEYTIRFDIKLVYSSGKCTAIPRLKFTRSGTITYYDSSMSYIYIKNDENRYKIDVSGCSRSSSSKNSTATDSSVEPLRATGSLMLADLANSNNTVSISFNGTYDFTTNLSLSTIKDFYNTCKDAGVFDQEELYEYTDDYYVITLFNEGSVGTEEVIEKEESAPSEEE